MSNEPIYTLDSWEGYTTHIKEKLNRVLTESEYKVIMAAYISRKDIEELIKELKCLV